VLVLQEASTDEGDAVGSVHETMEVVDEPEPVGEGEGEREVVREEEGGEEGE